MAESHPETSALIAVMNDDPDEARGLLAGFYPRELAELDGHLDTLSGLISEARRAQRRAGR